MRKGFNPVRRSDVFADIVFDLAGVNPLFNPFLIPSFNLRFILFANSNFSHRACRLLLTSNNNVVTIKQEEVQKHGKNSNT